MPFLGTVTRDFLVPKRTEKCHAAVNCGARLPAPVSRGSPEPKRALAVGLAVPLYAVIGRSEALRRSMVALIEQGAPHEAHPAYWAPFIVVGEGGADGRATEPFATSSIIPEPQAPAKAAPSRSRTRPEQVTPPNWRTQIWGQ